MFSTKAMMTILTLLFDIILRALASAIRQGKEMYKDRKEEIKLYLQTDDLKESTKLKLYEVSRTKHGIFLQTWYRPELLKLSQFTVPLLS